jgi:hypothetical protein
MFCSRHHNSTTISHKSGASDNIERGRGSLGLINLRTITTRSTKTGTSTAISDDDDDDDDLTVLWGIALQIISV